MSRARILADYVAGGTTAAEFDYMDGVTSNVQTQLDAKAPLASPTFTGNFTSVGIDDNADATAITIDSSERVGINATSPRTKLEIVQSAFGAGEGLRLAKTLSEYWDFDVFADSGNKMTISNYNAGQVMTMVNDGKVGIGTTSPNEAFHIKGAGTTFLKIERTGTGASHWTMGMVNGQNYFEIQNEDVARLQINSSGYFTGSGTNDISDERLKENITTVSDALDKIKGLTGRKYNWKTDSGMDTDAHYGLIAQEVEGVVPELVYNGSGIRKINKTNSTVTDAEIGDDVEYAKSLHMSGVIPILIEAVKELSAKNDALEAENTALKTRMDALEARVTALESE